MSGKSTWWKPLVFGLAACILVPSTASAASLVFDGIEFPHGEKSFVDTVVSYRLDDPNIGEEYGDPEKALGIPDRDSSDTINYVSLGNAVADEVIGELIFSFDSNRLIDVEGDDLYIFEIGDAVEATDVAISIDGETWHEIGRVEGSTRGIDLADHPTVPERRGYRYVRIRDFPDGRTSPAPYPGPDIDAIGAIGSVDAGEIAADGRFLVDIEDGSGCSSTGAGGGSGSASLLFAVLGFGALRSVRRRERRLGPCKL